MNSGIYKLVYSHVLQMMVPVSEAVRCHAINSTRRVRVNSARHFRFTLLLGVVLVHNAWGDTTLPAGISIRGIVDSSTRVVSSSANAINFQQLKPAAVVDFNQLNLGKGQQFNVEMRPTWSMLSRIHDVNPSILNGQVNAAGNLYFLNANGIVIGKDAQFNVGSLYAGTLDITNAMFQDGFVNQETFSNPFSLVATIDLDEAARHKIENAQVLVQGGARINTTNNGKVMLFAPNVKVEENAIIQTPEGQTILAAGKKIYLQGSADPAGFLVEVDAGGTATNLGRIVAERGNVTMMGLAVNQSGTVSATTSVRANGSIRLIAQDKVNVVGVSVTGARNGRVTLGTGSVTEVRPELADAEETIASQPFKTSDVTIEASLINIDGAIRVKGGNVTAKTEFDVSPELASPATRRIFLGENASIDVSGVDAIAPMSRNQLEVQLFSDQLKDAPILRGSGLFRSTVYVDARKGTSLFDIQPFLDLRGATVAERMTNAGKVTLATNQELLISQGATIDVSGGSTTFTAGTVKETHLIFNGRLVPISEAQPGVAYNTSADTLTVRDPRWGATETFELGGATRFVPSYSVGNNAGTVDLTTPIETERTSVLVMAGNIVANTRPSREQLLNQTTPLGGQLIASAKTLTLGTVAKPLAEGFSFSDAIADATTFVSEINTGFLAAGFNRIDFTKMDDLTINTALTLDSHGSLILGNPSANTVTRLNANLVAPASNIKFQSQTTRINDNVSVSTAGIFTNDRPFIPGALTREVAANGGHITAGVVQFGQNVSLDASAGAWVDALGGWHQGRAGNIAFATFDALPNNLQLQSYGFQQGGQLSITFGDFAIKRNLFVASSHTLGSEDIAIDRGFLQQGGFSDYALRAFNVTIGGSGEPNQTLYASQQNWRMHSGFLNEAGGQPMSVVARPVTLPDFSRQAASLRFESPSPLPEQGSINDLGNVTLAANTTLRTDRGGNVSLQAGKQVNVLGDIVAPSGNITLRINDGDTFKEDAGVIFIGEQATLRAAGSTITFADSRPQLLNNQVVKAGSININQPQDSVFKGAVVMKEGAVLDVSGASIVNDTRTTRGFVRETLFGDAGTININGSGALLLDGSFRADAQGTGRDGSLNLVFRPQAFNEENGLPNFPNNSGSFFITHGKQLASTGLNLGDAIKDASQAATQQATQYLKAQISAEQITQGGFANLSLGSFFLTPSPASQIQLADNLTLNLAGNLLLNTPLIQVLDNGQASLNAGHITFRSPIQSVNTIGLGAGTGTLSASANQIYFNGVMSIAGVEQTNLNANFDIHGQGARSFTQLGNVATTGGLIANGNLTLTARQIYPESGANLTFEALGNNSQIVVNASQQVARPVLSAGGTLNLHARTIQQNGVLTAPFGAINLQADSVTLGGNSITSVSGNQQVIPFAVTNTGGEVFNPQAGASRPLMESKIDIQANAVDLQSGATLDLSASGDMFAFEWIPGLGGSRDVLAQPNTYAVIPNLNQIYAPRDLNMMGSSAAVMVGQTVYLNGGSGLPAGQYTLLPARYALVPGAFVVQVLPNNALLPGQVLPQQDGSALTTGYFGEVATGARDAMLSTFSVFSGQVFRPAAGTISRAPSQYLLTSANAFFNDPAKTGGVDGYSPLDVARLSLSATQLKLAADVVANTANGGRGLLVDLSADKIRVLNEQDASDTQSLQVRPGDLSAINAESVLLGGTRSQQNGRTSINTVATQVSFENDASQTLNVREILATAKESVVVADAAAMDTGARQTAKGKLDIVANGDGALLALSSQNDITFAREGSSANATQGELTIAANSQLSAGNSLVIDATKNVTLNGRLNIEEGGSVTLGANRILIGEAPANILGLNVNQASLAEFGNLATLTLNSYSNIDLFGSLNLGGSDLNLTLNSAGIVGHATASGGNQNSAITANNLTLKNSQNAHLIASTSPANSLTLQSRQLRIEGERNPTLVNNQIADSDKITIQGYNQLAIIANEVRVSQQGEAVIDTAQTTITSGRMGAETGANFGIRATGTLTTAQAAVTPVNTGHMFGGKLTLQANELTVGSRIETPSGQLTLRANNALRLTGDAQVSANSQAVRFDAATRDIAAGQIDLISDAGNIAIDSGANVSVTSLRKAEAGRVHLQARQGSVTVNGELNGAALGTGRGGELSVDVATLSNLSATNSRAQGFTESRTYRVRNGNVSIDGQGSEALAAKQIEVTADNGTISVRGEVNATSAKDGRIALYAGTGLTLENTARLNAASTAQGQQGGRVDLHTAAGNLDLAAGAVIDVSGAENALGGQVHLRAPRTGAGSGNGVAVTQLAGQIVGAKSTLLEAFRVFNGVNTITTGAGTGSTLGFNTVANDVTSFMSNQASILAGLGKSGDSHFFLQAGTEIRSNGNLTIANDWNLFPSLVTRTQNDVGVLTLRAAGNLQFTGSLSDGFTSANRNQVTLAATETTPAQGLATDHTWSYRLAAGADTTSANLKNTITSPINPQGVATTGNLILNNDRVIRTGKGFIDIATGGDVQLRNPGSVIYTVGRTADELAGFDRPVGTNSNALYLTEGGNISIHSQGSIVGAEPDSGRQLVNQWLFRQGGGSANRDTSWWIRPDLFRQGVATLGGGDVTVVAGGDIRNFSVAVPTTARFDNFGDANDPASGVSVINGGGDLTVKAGANIVNGTYFVAQGDGVVRAQGAIQPSGQGLGTVLAMQDGSFDVKANQDVYIATTFNPTLVNQSSTNTTSGDGFGGNSNFNSYSLRANVLASSVSGDVAYGSGDDVFARTTGLTANSGLALFFGYNPSKMELTSYSGNLSFGRLSSLQSLVMLPAADGNLNLFAAKDINLANIKMSDADPATLPGVNTPLNAAIVNVFNRLLDTHSPNLLHANNPEPALIVANAGDIRSDNRVLAIPKATRLVAGNDITNVNIALQNNRRSDVSLIKAGRDVNTRNIVIGGPGELLVQAGRNVDLIYPEITTINSTGNAGTRNPVFGNAITRTFAAIANPALPSEGASITLQAGLGNGANVEAYVNQYIVPTGSGPTTLANNPAKLLQYRANTAMALTQYMQEFTGDSELSETQALALFLNQSLETKTIFANRHLTSELIGSARDFAEAGNHDRGLGAIAALFPNQNKGDILLFNSKVSTNSGGSIDLIAPHGFINVGVPGQGGDIGIITEKGGEIRGVADGDFQVNQSKVITQFGSDIAIWSTNGTIDAGRGSKTATSVPERIVQTDAFGNTIIEVRGVAAGSGIRAQSYDPDGPTGPRQEPKKGNVFLTAPIVDAGEAGIEAGDLLIVAPVVLNAANIQVQGAATGVPVAATSSIAGVSAGLTPDAVNSATQAVAQTLSQKVSNAFSQPKLPSIISVDVISIGQ